MRKLSVERCVASRRYSPWVTAAEIAELRPQIPDWQFLEHDGIAQLERVFHFLTFAAALTFTNRIGAVAEDESTHCLCSRIPPPETGSKAAKTRPQQKPVRGVSKSLTS